MAKTTRANLLLTLTALIWGMAFVAQDVAADSMSPFFFNGLRMALAALALLPVIWTGDRRARRSGRPIVIGHGLRFERMTAAQRRTLGLGGLCCGAMLTLGSAFQQLGITLGTGAGKAGFITALYIVLVPLLQMLWGRRAGLRKWLAVALAVCGLYLLCVTDGLSLSPGDALLMLCALSFAGHILVVDHFSGVTDCVRLSCLQFAVTSALCMLGALLWEAPLNWRAAGDCLLPIAYAGLLSGGVGYTLQIVAQRDADPTVASLIMSLESVFAVLAGWVLLGDALTLRELSGCACMMGGIVLAQVKEENA